MNLFVEFELENYPKPNAYVVAPQIDVNHPWSTAGVSSF